MTAPIVVEARFGKSERTYDYLCDFHVDVGQRVYVPTSRGEAKVVVVAIKAASEAATVSALRIVDEEPDVLTDEQKAATYPNGAPKWSRDGTLLDENGNRSIFDDVDQ